MKSHKGLFLAFEGIDGSGKSTQVKLLTQKLSDLRHKVYATYEPTDGSVGSILRNILKGNTEADQRTIAGLFMADRLDHLLNKTDGILKKLEEGYTVITDRYYFSSYAYHSVYMSMDWVIQANAMSAEILRPDLTIYVDIQPEESMIRLKRDRTSMELYEKVETLRQVREKYLEAFDRLKADENIFTTDGNQAPDKVADNIWKRVSSLIN